MVTSDVKLDVEAFPAFRELLVDCQDYAALSGCRFQAYAFESNGVTGKANAEEWKAGVQKAMPRVKEFRKRVQAQEAGLVASIDVAYRLISAEGVRSGIVATCQEMGLWPPGVSIPEDDCAFQDTTASLPLIAQRAYNDEMRREREESLQLLYRKATTASFLVDFASEAGLALPNLTESHREMLDEFMKRVEEWSSQGGSSRFDLCPIARAGKALTQGLAKGGLAAEVAKETVKQRWSQNWDTTTGTAVNLVATAFAVAAAAAAVRRAARAK